MKVRNLAVTAALATTSTCTLGATPLEGIDERPEIPRVFARYVADDKELLAFKMVPDGELGHIVALITRYPKPPAPNRGAFYEDRKGYSCDLVILHEANGEVKIEGRSRHVLDCANNRANLVATYLELNEEVQLSSNRLSFNDEYLMGGSYGVSFDRSGDEWHLAQVSSVHKAVESTPGGVAFIKRQASYPKDFSYISMDRFDKALVEDALSKNEETYR